MDKILPAYHDPLFSILIIVVMILVVAIASNVVGNYQENRKKQQLKNFLGTLNAEECSLSINKIPFEAALIYPLGLLAKTLTTQGEYQKAISIYLYLIDHIPVFHEKEYLLEGLGQTYLKGGFLKRSESIFLEILRKHPRNQSVLYNLEVVYELLNDYEKAKQILTPLEILGTKLEKLQAHIELSTLIKNETLSSKEKIQRLCDVLHDTRYAYRRIMQSLFRLDLAVAWVSIQEEKIIEILDLLWFLPTSNLNFDIISNSPLLTGIFAAKGVVPIEKVTVQSHLFTINTLIAARRGGSSDVDLTFSYGCSNCKQQFPITFVRCPTCYAVDSIQIKESIAKKRAQTGYSLL